MVQEKGSKVDVNINYSISVCSAMIDDHFQPTDGRLTVFDVERYGDAAATWIWEQSVRPKWLR